MGAIAPIFVQGGPDPLPRTPGPPPSLLDHRAIQPPDLAPTTVQIVPPRREGRLGGFLLIHFDAPAGLLADPQIAVLHYRTIGENLLRPLIERRVLLDPEVVTHQVQRDVRHMPHRRHVARTVPCRLDSEVLRQNRELARRCKSARLRNVDADVVDQAFANERLPFVRAVEQLSYGERRGTVLPDLAEVGDILGS